jgi:hypothetical protein
MRGAFHDQQGCSEIELNTVPFGLVKTIFNQVEMSIPGIALPTHPKEPNLSTVALLDGIYERLCHLEALEEVAADNTPDPPDLTSFLQRTQTSESVSLQSLFKVSDKTRKHQRLLVFSLHLGPILTAGSTTKEHSRKMARVLLDSGSTYNICSAQYVTDHHFEMSPLDHTVHVSLADGKKKVLSD